MMPRDTASLIGSDNVPQPTRPSVVPRHRTLDGFVEAVSRTEGVGRTNTGLNPSSKAARSCPGKRVWTDFETRRVDRARQRGEWVAILTGKTTIELVA